MLPAANRLSNEYRALKRAQSRRLKKRKSIEKQEGRSKEDPPVRHHPSPLRNGEDHSNQEDIVLYPTVSLFLFLLFICLFGEFFWFRF